MKSRFFFRLLPMLLLLATFSCETDQLTSILYSPEEQMQLSFTLDEFYDPSATIVENIEVQWDRFETQTFKNQEWYEFEITQLQPKAFANNGTIKGQHYSLLAHQSNKGIKYFIAVMNATSITDDYKVNYFDIAAKSFGGTVTLYNLKGEVEFGFHFEKGHLQSSLENTKNEADVSFNSIALIAKGGCHNKTLVSRCESTNNCDIFNGGLGSNGESFGSCGGSALAWVQVDTYMYWYYSSGGYTWLANIDYLGRHYELAYVSNSALSQGSGQINRAETYGVTDVGSGNTTISNVEPKIDLDDDKIFNKLKGKAKCIFDKLEANSKDFKDAIRKFDPEFPVAHLNFEIDNELGFGIYGVTDLPQHYNITIRLSNNNLSEISNLGSATVIAHEIVHAEIYRKLMIAARKGDLKWQGWNAKETLEYIDRIKNNFSDIYEFYILNYHEEWNHDLMAAHYTEVIADVIEQFDGGKLPRQVYEDIAWMGLNKFQNGMTAEAWEDLSDTEKLRILANINQYIFVSSDKTCK